MEREFFFDTCIRRDLCDVDVDGNGATCYENDDLPHSMAVFILLFFYK